MQLFLAAAPGELSQARKMTSRTACAAYRIDIGGHLAATRIPYAYKGGWMLLRDQEAGPVANTHMLCREIVRECAARCYSGVVADFTRKPSADRRGLIEQLEVVLRMNRRALTVPEAYGDAAITAQVLIGTAISGGTLTQRLAEAAERWGAAHLALDLERLNMDFLLPSPSGMGKPLTVAELEALRQEKAPATFFSTDLCARYFTYREGGEYHFVLFDDADTLQRKIRLGQRMGIRTGFLMLPEVADLLPELKRSGILE